MLPRRSRWHDAHKPRQQIAPSRPDAQRPVGAEQRHRRTESRRRQKRADRLERGLDVDAPQEGQLQQGRHHLFGGLRREGPRRLHGIQEIKNPLDRRPVRGGKRIACARWQSIRPADVVREQRTHRLGHLPHLHRLHEIPHAVGQLRAQPGTGQPPGDHRGRRPPVVFRRIRRQQLQRLPRAADRQTVGMSLHAPRGSSLLEDLLRKQRADGLPQHRHVRRTPGNRPRIVRHAVDRVVARQHGEEEHQEPLPHGKSVQLSGMDNSHWHILFSPGRLR